MSERVRELPNGYERVLVGRIIPPGMLAWKPEDAPDWEWRLEEMERNFEIPHGYICYAQASTPQREEW